jgi:hypothetical protein
MSPDTVNQVVPSTEPDTLRTVYRRLGAMHATLAEADHIGEGLQRRTLDRLMDVLEIIEDDPRLAKGGRQLFSLAFFPCERVESTGDRRVIVHPLYGGEATRFPAYVPMTLYGRCTGDLGTYAIDLILVSLDTRESWHLGGAGVELEEQGEVQDFAFPTQVSFPAAGKYEFQFRANRHLVAKHPWMVRREPAAGG